MRPQIVKNIIAPVALYLFTCATLLGQTDTVNSGPPAPALQRTPPELPIDNGILILLFAGITYGIFIALKMRAKNREA